MKVGDYVRTKYGNIGKITNLNEQFSQVEYQDNQTRCDTNESNILKSSPNIIDLIEVGDYVNGSKVVRIEKHDEELYAYVQETEYCNACDEEENIYYKENTIKSIVTKEQFSQMEYKVNKND